jgi:hypothetical protein
MEDAIRLKSRRFSGKYFLLLILVLTATAASLLGIYLWRQGSDEESIRVVTGLQFPYPEGWTEQPLSDADKNAGLVLMVNSEQPTGSFLARTVIGQPAADLDMNKLAGDTEAALAGEIQGFELISKEVTVIGGFQAVQIDYRQDSADPPGGHRVRMTIIPTANQTFYLTTRAARSDFNDISDESRKIVEDFMAYVSAAGQ